MLELFLGGRALEDKLIEVKKNSYEYFVSHPDEARAKKPSLAKYFQTHKPTDSDPISYISAGVIAFCLSSIAVNSVAKYIDKRK